MTPLLLTFLCYISVVSRDAPIVDAPLLYLGRLGVTPLFFTFLCYSPVVRSDAPVVDAPLLYLGR